MIVFIYGLSNSRVRGINLILERKFGLIVKVLLCFEFIATNNQAKYESFIVSLTVASKAGEEEF